MRRLTASKYQFHDTELSGCVKNAYHALAIDEHRDSFSPTLWRYKPKPDQDIEQVWFAGCHSDIGGGYPERGLSDIPLAWLLHKANEAGLALDAEALAAYPMQPDPNAALHDSRTMIFRLLPDHERQIGRMKDPDTSQEGIDPTQSLHVSVLTRWDQDPTYRPKNLRDYLRYIQDPRSDT